MVTADSTITSAERRQFAIVEIRFVQHGNLKAYVDVDFGGVVIRDFRIIQQPGQRAYTSVPQVQYTGSDGTRQFAPLVRFTNKAFAAEVKQRVLDEYKRQALTFTGRAD